jgi:hypothetical protein
VPLHLTATLVPGINAMPALPLAAGATLTNPFAFGPPGTQGAGAARHLPCSYAGFAKHIANSTFDAVIVTVAPPGPDGRASLGPAVEFTPTALARSGRMIVVINHALPPMPGAPTIALQDAALVVETDSPLCSYDAGAATPEALAIATGIAGFIGDGATVQIGIGKVPDALLRALTDRRGLRLHSGMLSDGMQALAGRRRAGPHASADRLCACRDAGALRLAARPGGPCGGAGQPDPRPRHAGRATAAGRGQRCHRGGPVRSGQSGKHRPARHQRGRRGRRFCRRRRPGARRDQHHRPAGCRPPGRRASCRDLAARCRCPATRWR